MRRIIIVRWDIQIGPQPIIQYPPEQNFPEKDIFLKVWAHHEMNANSAYVELKENKQKYLSFLQKENNELYFIVLQLEISDEGSSYQDILSKLANTLFSAINTPKLARVVSETYNTVQEYSQLSVEQLFFNLFSDRDKLNILDIIRSGVIQKKNLAKILKEKFGTMESSLDILLNPFFHLNMIVEEDSPGLSNSIYFVEDVYCSRIPSKTVFEEARYSMNPSDIKYVNEVTVYFNKYSMETDDDILRISKILSNIYLYKTLQTLTKKKQSKSKFLELLGQDMDLFQRLIDENIIFELEETVYPFSEVHFFTFKPIYLLKDLKTRYLNNEISTDQFIRQVKLLE